MEPRLYVFRRVQKKKLKKVKKKLKKAKKRDENGNICLVDRGQLSDNPVILSLENDQVRPQPLFKNKELKIFTNFYKFHVFLKFERDKKTCSKNMQIT